MIRMTGLNSRLIPIHNRTGIDVCTANEENKSHKQKDKA